MKHKYVIWLVFVLLGCSPALFELSWAQEKAPKNFKAQFYTTHGPFVLELERDLAPNGVDRVFQLVKRGFYQDMAIYHVVPGQVVFGISNDTLMNYAWRSVRVENDPGDQTTGYAQVAFYPDDRNERSVLLVINTSETEKLPLVPVANVVSGMENIHLFFAEYGQKPMQTVQQAYQKGNKHWQRNFPELDYIQRSELVLYNPDIQN